MRITPKKFKEYVEKNLSGITDQELFTSEYLRFWLENMATAVTGRYHRPVKVRLEWVNPHLAYTNNETITITAGHDYVLSLSNRLERFKMIVGLLAHETAHILYTDFIENNRYNTSMRSGAWYPKRPEFRHEKYMRRIQEIEAELDSSAGQILSIAHHLLNLFEDEAIERRMRREYPGSFKEGLDFKAAVTLAETPSVREILDMSDSKLALLQGLLFRYVLCGDRDFREAGPRLNRWMAVCEPYFIQAAKGPMLKRLDAVNHLLVLLWPYIDLTQEQEPPPMRGGSVEPNGATSPVNEQNSQGSGAEGSETEVMEGTDTEKLSGLAEEILDSVRKQIAEERANQEIEGDLSRELDAELQRMDLGEMHGEITSHIFRASFVEPELIEAYQTETPELQRLARRMCEKMRQESFERGRGGKRTGLYSGRLNIRQATREDGKCFYRRKLPATGLDLAVSVLVDESGSMYWDDRITKARDAAIVLYEFCRAFEVPALVYGHTADNGYDLSLYAYAEYDSIDNQDRYRLMDMQARNYNRDGAAVSYMAHRLLARPEQVKLLLIPTDGLPNAKGYCGAAAEKDLQQTVQKYERLGLVIYALAMDDDCERLREIYGSHFLDASDLNRLPQLMVRLVKENMKE